MVYNLTKQEFVYIYICIYIYIGSVCTVICKELQFYLSLLLLFRSVKKYIFSWTSFDLNEETVEANIFCVSFKLKL